MENNAGSPEFTVESCLPATIDKHNLVKAPKDYFLGPVFAASKHAGRREITIGDKLYIVGGFHPLRADFSPPALDVRHARAIFTLLSFREPYSDNGREIRFAFNDFCRRYANSQGGRYMRAIKDIVGELMDSYIQVTDLNTKLAHTYRLINEVAIRGKAIARRDSKSAQDKQTEMKLNRIVLSEEFYNLLGRIAELQDLKLDVFTGIRSPLAQAIYLYIPSRSVHHAEGNPFEITLSKLLEQVSFRRVEFKSKRLELFTKHSEENRAIIQQLDGLETLKGRFRVRLAETADGSDWKLLTWVEAMPTKRDPSVSNSKLVTAYLESGRPKELLDQALSNVEPLDDYELDLLKEAKVEFEKNRRFFEVAKALLRKARFDGLLAEAKADEKEGRKARKNPTARLIHRIMEAVGAPVAAQQTRGMPGR
jgi:hypothetical protein